MKTISANTSTPEELEEQARSDAVKKQLEECDNLLKREDVTHTGWICEDITDLGGPYVVCQMCVYQIIRYVHHMYHPEYGRIDAGCICAGKMEGNIEEARKESRKPKTKPHAEKTLKSANGRLRETVIPT